MWFLAKMIGGWFIGGRSWFSNILAAGLIATAAAGGGYAFGYMWGYAKADNAAEVRNLKATVRSLQTEIDRRDDAEAEANELASEMSRQSSENDEVSNALSPVIENTPLVGGCVPPAFLDGLRLIR